MRMTRGLAAAAMPGLGLIPTRILTKEKAAELADDPQVTGGG